jgi:hypothetical protein
MTNSKAARAMINCLAGEATTSLLVVVELTLEFLMMEMEIYGLTPA